MPEISETMVPQGELFLPPDVDGAREFFRQKSRAMTDKRMSVSEAVARFIHDRDYIATGGFGNTRIPTAILHEILRTHKHHLGFSAHCTMHDFQILAAGQAVDRTDISYAVGLEMFGLSPNARRYLESGAVRTVEWSNAGLAWRFKAAAMGVPFLPARVMLGTDTERRSAAKEITCPYTDQTYLAVPALYPDVGIIHVHQADCYGNAQIDGISVIDLDIARASKHLILTTERIVDTEEFRRHPGKTSIVYWQVDAVCEVPFGSYPGQMPYEYTTDEQHFTEWLEAEKDAQSLAAFLDRYIYGTKNFAEYLALACSEEHLRQLQAMEPLKREEPAQQVKTLKKAEPMKGTGSRRRAARDKQSAPEVPVPPVKPAKTEESPL